MTALSVKNKIQNKIKNIQVRKLKNNTQKVGLRLLSSIDEWIPRSRLEKIPSATSRIRDLRKEKFGAFNIECKSSDDLNKKVSKRMFYYRVVANKITNKQLDTLFPNI